MSHWSVAALVVLLVGLATLVTHWPALHANAFMFDDYLYLVDNPLVRNPGLASAWRYLTEVRRSWSLAGGYYYQPLPMISLMVDCALGGRPDNLLPFRVTSLALHATTTVLVTVFFYVLFRRIGAAALAGLLFGLHPCSVESVAWLSDRKTLLSGIFGTACLLAYALYASHRGRTAYLTCVGCYLLALFSKPVCLTLPLVMLALDIWPLARFGRRAIVEKVPLLLLMVVFTVVTRLSQPPRPEGITPASIPLTSAMLVIAHNISFYAYKLLWPVQLSALYPYPHSVSLSQPDLQLAVAGCCVILIVLAISLRWTRALAVGWLAFFLAVLPAIWVSLQPLDEVSIVTAAIAADRFTYLPKIGFLLPLACGLCHVLNRPQRKTTVWVCGVAIALFAAFGEAYCTRRYLAFWRDTEGLQRYMVAYAPDSAYLRSNLGNVLQGQGKSAEAVEQYRAALRIEDDPAAHTGLAAVLAQQNQWTEAETHLRAALRLYPQYAGARENLAVVLDHLGKLDEAAKFFEDALRDHPDSVGSLYQFGMLRFRQSRMEQAASLFGRALAVDKDHGPTHYQLGCLHLAAGKTSDGLDEWRRAIATQPDFVEVMDNLAWILSTIDDTALRNNAEAVELAERCCSLTNRENPAMLDTLGAAYANAGRFDEAITTARACMEGYMNAGNGLSADAVRRRLDAYRAGKPWREKIDPAAYRPH